MPARYATQAEIDAYNERKAAEYESDLQRWNDPDHPYHGALGGHRINPNLPEPDLNDADVRREIAEQDCTLGRLGVEAYQQQAQSTGWVQYSTGPEQPPSASESIGCIFFLAVLVISAMFAWEYVALMW